jgi:hypothetical protein
MRLGDTENVPLPMTDATQARGRAARPRCFDHTQVQPTLLVQAPITHRDRYGTKGVTDRILTMIELTMKLPVTRQAACLVAQVPALGQQ